MKKLNFLFVILISGILQVTLLDGFKVFNVKPDLLLISVVFAGLFFELKWAFLFSIIAGLFKDIFGTTSIGINVLLFPTWSFLIAQLKRQVSFEDSFMRMALLFVVCFLQNLITGLALGFFGEFTPLGVFLKILFISSIYTALLLPVISRFIKPDFYS
ncbi:MAG: rod shape-determining protein MreD [Candidatus Omnitrophica bacterium]|nr:rod shape-determining protein MreD [Candidatus Omnitrophota bacterium]